MNAPSRRSFLTAGAGLLVTGTAIADAATVATGRVPGQPPAPRLNAAADPVVALCERITGLIRQRDQVNAAYYAVRADLVSRYGKNQWGSPPPELCAIDPAHDEFMRLMHESDRLNGEIGNLFTVLVPMPATSPAGALAKLRIALGSYLWPDYLKLEWHHKITLDLLRDAERGLAGVA